MAGNGTAHGHIKMANDVKTGVDSDAAEIDQQVFSADWVGKISYLIFRHR
jgi:hypothetical protein